MLQSRQRMLQKRNGMKYGNKAENTNFAKSQLKIIQNRM